jgi:hypothetical protein
MNDKAKGRTKRGQITIKRIQKITTKIEDRQEKKQSEIEGKKFNSM